MLNNQPHGRCITVYSYGRIYIDYRKNGGFSVGNWLEIYADGDIDLGDRFADANRVINYKCTRYKGIRPISTRSGSGKTFSHINGGVKDAVQPSEIVDFDSLPNDTGKFADEKPYEGPID